MTAEDLLNILEQRQLVSAGILASLRKQVAGAAKPIPPASVIKLLVDKQQLTPGQAEQLLRTAATPAAASAAKVLAANASKSAARRRQARRRACRQQAGCRSPIAGRRAGARAIEIDHFDNRGQASRCANSQARGILIVFAVARRRNGVWPRSPVPENECNRPGSRIRTGRRWCPPNFRQRHRLRYRSKTSWAWRHQSQLRRRRPW